MRVNPFADVLAFLTQGGVTTVIFWLLVIASLAIAVRAYSAAESDRGLSGLANYALRFFMGCMWWQQSLWKVPPYYTDQPQEPFGTTGLAYWMGEMVKWSAFPIQGRLVRDVVLANFYLFAPLVYGVEVLIGVSLMWGVLTRLGGLAGALMAANLWLGLYRSPDEWPWTYFFLLVIQVLYTLHPPGRSLGLDVLLRSSAARGGGAGLRNRVVEAAT